MQLPLFLRAFRSRNYRLYFSGQWISLIGNWMTTTASLWLVYHLSNNAFYVGMVGFATQIPVLIMAPFTGVWVDRIDRHRLMIWLQALACLQSLSLGLLALSGAITVPRLLLLCFFQGLINGWDIPVRQSFIVQMVDDRADLPNAIALGSSMFNLARLVGPAIAGFVIAGLGAGGCYLLDAASYLPVIGCLLAMRIKKAPPRTTAHRHPLTDLREGLEYVNRTPVLRGVLMLVPVAALAGWSTSVLAPIFARDVFHGDARLLGFMLTSIGCGALAGALALSARRTTEELDHVIIFGAFIIASGMIVVAASPWLPLTLIGMAACGFGGVRTMAGSNTLVQSTVEDDKRGRVMGLFAMGQGMFPIGSLIVGALTEAIGPRLAATFATIVILVGATLFARLRPRAPQPLTPV